jgi:hypothetical protein
MTRGETALTLVVFVLVYGGVTLPQLGATLGVFFASRFAGGSSSKVPTPPDRDRQG